MDRNGHAVPGLKVAWWSQLIIGEAKAMQYLSSGLVQVHPCSTLSRLLSRKVLVRPYTPQLNIKRRALIEWHGPNIQIMRELINSEFRIQQR